jgi:hypothetical protein
MKTIFSKEGLSMPGKNSHTTSKLLLLFSLVLAFAQKTGATDTKSVVHSIILPKAPDPYESMAAAKLKEYIFKITNKDIETKHLSDKEKISKGSILIGKAALKTKAISEEEISEMGGEGYIIKNANGNIYIAGGKYGGTLNGAYRLLEEFGVKFFALDHVEIPRKTELKTENIKEIRSKPFFESRLYLSPVPENLNFQLQASPNGVDKKLDKHWKRMSWEHTNQFLVPIEIYGKDHPEYYAKNKDGASYATDWVKNKTAKEPNIMLCLSNHKVREIAKKRLFEWIKTKPEKRNFMVAQMDGLGWCQCKECQKLDTKPGEIMTDRILDYVSELASEAYKNNKDKIIMTPAYTYKAAPPPERIKSLPENVRICLCLYPPEVKIKSRWLDHKLNKEFLPWYKGWLEKFPGQIYIYDYPYVSFNCVNFIHEQMFERIKKYAKDGIKGIHFNSCPFFMRSLFNYVAARLAWDPSSDTAKLTKEFILSYYGAGGPQMLEVYDLLSKTAKRPDRLQGITTDIRDFLDLEECEKLLELYDKAEENAKDDKVILKRLREDKSYVLCTMLEKSNPLSGQVKDMEKFKKRLGELVAIVADPKSRNGLNWGRPELLESWLWRIARIKTNSNKRNRLNDPTIKRLINDPLSFEFKNKALQFADIEKVSDGYIIPTEKFKGGMPLRYCGKNALKLLSRRYDNFYVRVPVKLDRPIEKSALIIGGMDCEKPGSATIRIEVNGKEIFRDENNMSESGWSDKRFELPDNIFKKGENTILIENMEEEDNPFDKWILLHSVKIETKDAPKTLFLSHFDKSADADKGANPKATNNAGFKITPDGKWGGALDCAENQNTHPLFYYQAPGNINPEKGTLEMWIKQDWDCSKDPSYRPVFMLYGNLSGQAAGFLIFKHESNLSVLFYGPKNKRSYLNASITDWKRNDKWRHIALTWDKKSKTAQLFIDGIPAAQSNKIFINSEMPQKIYIASIEDPLYKRADILIDELRIVDTILWKGENIKEKVFEPPVKPYQETKQKN